MKFLRVGLLIVADFGSESTLKQVSIALPGGTLCVTVANHACWTCFRTDIHYGKRADGTPLLAADRFVETGLRPMSGKRSRGQTQSVALAFRPGVVASFLSFFAAGRQV
jgi:hypothetical protein